MDNDQDMQNEMQAPAEAEAQEKTLTQSEVNRLVARTKAETREKAQREAEERYKAELEQIRQQAPQMGGMGLNEQEIYDKVYGRLVNELQTQAEADAQKRHQEEMERVANDYHTKMSAGRELFEDFDDKIKDFNPAAFPRTVYLASLSDSTPQLMYELAQNPSKLVTLENLAERDPRAAEAMLGRLTASIKENERAKQEAQAQQANDPLSRLKPSTVGSDNGQMSIRDFKNADWLRV